MPLWRIGRGRLGADFYGMPSLELVTIGRKSGRRHAVMPTAPSCVGECILVASRGGDPMHPAWFWNIRDNPGAEVSFRDGPWQPMARRVLSTEERAVLWPCITADYPVYGDYQKRTTREIPLVRPTPR
ncbi:nitroreductase/quinone reductase family protein [Nocardia brevicatena]|uniref:nitroreductase/quinone reductase family protein n=1 Tax=Nocardia brevicatena TaxID=37327 RepID=UPI0002E92A72|nr:nitroreductase/quinone reductase family protein [Nocardia brevicatena]